MKYEQLKALKKELVNLGKEHGIKVYHYFNDKPSGSYIVWSEDDTIRAFGDGVAGQKAVQGTVDYFTKMEYDPIVDEIDDALQGVDLAFLDGGPTIDYETKTGYIHYQWIFEVM